MKKASFLNREKPPLTVMIQKRTPGEILDTVKKAIPAGAEAFAIQIDQLMPAYHREEVYRELFAAMEGRPCYVTYYRWNQNEGRPDEYMAEGLLKLASAGATLCDVYADMFDPQPNQLSVKAEAVEKQRALIDRLHGMGAEVLSSSHYFQYITPNEVVRMAKEQQARGADIAKIVISTPNRQAQTEHLYTFERLKQELHIPYLFLSGGDCHFLRRVGPLLGTCMYLCVYEHDEMSTPMQPLLQHVKEVRDHFELY